jgi:hypothetical protein
MHTRLEELTLEIAREIVEGREVADIVMEERERAGDVSARRGATISGSRSTARPPGSRRRCAC